MTFTQAQIVRAVKAALDDCHSKGFRVAKYRVVYSSPPEITILEVTGGKPSREVRRIVRGRMVARLHNAHRWLQQSLGWEKLVGYSVDELCSHLAWRFQPGMSWDNIDAWHIDHIRPLASYKIESVESAEFKEAWALANLQPLWAGDNIRKGARYP